MGLAGSGKTAAWMKAIRDDSPAARMGVLLAMRRERDPEIARFLSDSDPRLVLEAARAIHDVPIAAALPRLASLPLTSTAPLPLLRRVLECRFPARRARARRRAGGCGRARRSAGGGAGAFARAPGQVGQAAGPRRGRRALAADCRAVRAAGSRGARSQARGVSKLVHRPVRRPPRSALRLTCRSKRPAARWRPWPSTPLGPTRCGRLRSRPSIN